MFRTGWQWAKGFMTGAALVIPPWVVFSDVAYTIRSVDGVSMEPTLNPDGKNVDFVLLNRWAASSLSFEKGEVVSLVSPKDPNQWLIKRVVALEGDEVKSNSCFEEQFKVPKGHCWVEGDNVNQSMDSNNFGPVPTGLITAKASHVVWPPARWRRLETKVTATDRVIDKADVERGKHFFDWDLE